MKYQVRLESAEAQRLAEQLKVSREEFISNYTDPRWPGKDTFLIRHQNGACIFLERKEGSRMTRCLIHSCRPQDCRDWTAALDRPECQPGLAVWGLKVSPAGELEGSVESLRNFRTFLDELASE